jgi:hypothetical protein
VPLGAGAGAGAAYFEKFGAIDGGCKLNMGVSRKHFSYQSLLTST